MAAASDVATFGHVVANNSCHPNIKFTMETEERGQLPFLDVLLSKQSVSDRQGSFITSVYRKKTYTGLLTYYFSFTPFKYKLGLIKTLIDRAYKINNTTQGFHNDIKNLSEILKHNLFPKWLIDKSVKGYLSKVTTTGKDASKCEISNCHFYKLPYIGYYSSYTGRKNSSIVNKYCKDLNVKIIFSPFKLSTMFSPKDFIPDSLKSRVVYQFTCASCPYETSRSAADLQQICFDTNRSTADSFIVCRVCFQSAADVKPEYSSRI